MFKCYLRRLMADHRIDDITDLMKRSGLSRNAINRLYKEINIESTQLDTLIKLCNTFKCKLSDLLEYIPDNDDDIKTKETDI